MSFGEERLIGFSNWGNSSRSWDGARLTYQGKGYRLDWFSAAVAPQRKDLFDKPERDNKLHGFYPSLQNWIKGSTVEPYFIVKQSRNIEAYTYGVRMIGKLPWRFDYSSDTAGQAGTNGNDRIRAWAGHWVFGEKLADTRFAPRLLLEYNYGSGDKDPKDGKFGTFDQLYPTNHSKYGTADRISWRNSRDLMAGSEWTPHKAWRLLLDYHKYDLATTQDALYTEGGAVFVRNAKATSGDIGREVDLQVTYKPGKHFLFVGGIGRFWPGQFLIESSKHSHVWAPYLGWSFLF